MAFTADGQARESLVQDRDLRLGVSTPRRRRCRSSIPAPDVTPGANAWESGRTVQLRPEETDFTW